jgi:hypothetical protein
VSDRHHESLTRRSTSINTEPSCAAVAPCNCYRAQLRFSNSADLLLSSQPRLTPSSVLVTASAWSLVPFDFNTLNNINREHISTLIAAIGWCWCSHRASCDRNTEVSFALEPVRRAIFLGVSLVRGRVGATLYSVRQKTSEQGKAMP